MTVISSVFSTAIPSLVKTKLGIRGVWSLGLFTMGVSLLLLSITRQVYFSMILFSLIGLNFSVVYTIPWSIITSIAADRDDRAIVTTTFNLSQCFPEFIVAIFSWLIIGFFGGNSESVLCMGGLGSLCGCVYVIYYCEIPSMMKIGKTYDSESKLRSDKFQVNSLDQNVNIQETELELIDLNVKE